MNEKLHLQCLAVALSICMSAWCGASPARGEVISRPESIGDGWRTSTLAAEGLDEARIAKITEGIANGRFEGIHSYLIIKNGKLVHENTIMSLKAIIAEHRMAIIGPNNSNLIILDR